MSFIGNAIGKVIGGITGANQAADAAQSAANTQANAAQAGIDATNQRFDQMQKLLQPFVNAGTGALTAQQNLIGLNGAPAQQGAIDALRASPEYQALTQQGQNAILANASATGGLRGGNVQAALAQFQPQLLAQLINEQYGRLGGLTQIGQNSAGGVVDAGLQTGSNVANLLQQQGAATAGGQLAQGGVVRQSFGDLLKIGGMIAGAGGFGSAGGAPAGAGAVNNTLF